MKTPFKHSFWEEFQKKIDQENFRGEGHYLAQLNGATKEQYVAAYDYALNAFPGLLSRLQEDGAFGAITFDVDGRKISRDLIDSALELEFLTCCLISGTGMLDRTWLDIGAGYGRFASRLLEAFPNNTVYCTDAIPTSSDICRRYLEHRKVKGARIWTMDALVGHGPIDIAVNIHSWSECTLEAVQFWIDWIVSRNVRWLFVVPHDAGFRAREENGETPSFLPLILKHYDLVKQQEKYPPGIDGAFPTVYALFELRLCAGSAGRVERSSTPERG